eukprot:CAMPEP_0201710298 /NCGR_PEP_ID=MMETSP0578-20130828/58556_1 /ASSEMBLY_ACC=CAM_ASM_000663 /TAXON_ID=267565 /ORGANISM="Skeletonema grethea, Strain CCMP 1804" /LENGTH=390 /DNA_ID=CAMNT_0048199327 /DNA_START=61 /DNA_END=1233 /DNA_ORIENTATION=+
MSSDDDANPHIMATIESLMRITLAGFGGALAGISISRRGGLATASQQAQALAKKVATPNNNVIKQSRTQRRQAIRSAPPVLRPSIDRELPTAWAVACMAFAGVVEFTRLVSPTTFVSQFITPPLQLESDDNIQLESVQENDNDDAAVTANPDAMKYGTTIIDYTIGGGIAGALFKGSAVRTPTGARLDASIMGNYSASSSVSTAIKGKPLSGILPGAALGLLAGVSIVTMEYAQILIEEKFGVVENDDNTVVIVEVAPMKTNDEIPADIKAMTSEELAASIQSLRSGRVESKGDEPQILIEEKFGVEQAGNTDMIAEVAPQNTNDDIPADIKAMTSEELAASIQSLRSGRVESKGDERVEDEKLQEEESNNTDDKVTDLLYSIGFRPHQS